MAHLKSTSFEYPHGMMSDKEQAEAYRQGMIMAQQALVMQDKRAETQYQTARDEVVLLQKQLDSTHQSWHADSGSKADVIEALRAKYDASLDIVAKQAKLISETDDEEKEWSAMREDRDDFQKLAIERRKHITELEKLVKSRDDTIRTGIAQFKMYKGTNAALVAENEALKSSHQEDAARSRRECMEKLQAENDGLEQSCEHRARVIKTLTNDRDVLRDMHAEYESVAEELEKLEFVFAQVRQQRDQSLELAKTRAVELEEVYHALDIARGKNDKQLDEYKTGCKERQDRIFELEERCEHLTRTGKAIEKQIVDAYQATAEKQGELDERFSALVESQADFDELQAAFDDKTTELDECRAANAAFATQYGVKSDELEDALNKVDNLKSDGDRVVIDRADYLERWKREEREHSASRHMLHEALGKCDHLKVDAAELRQLLTEHEEHSDICIKAVENAESKARDSRLDAQTRSTVCEALRTTIAELKMQVSENETHSDLCLAAVKDAEKQAQDLQSKLNTHVSVLDLVAVKNELTFTQNRLSVSLIKQETYKSILVGLGVVAIDGDPVDSFEDEVNNE